MACSSYNKRKYGKEVSTAALKLEKETGKKHLKSFHASNRKVE